MIYRIIVGVGLLALGYYLGREVGRAEPVREELRRARESGRRPSSPNDDAIDHEPTPPEGEKRPTTH